MVQQIKGIYRYRWLLQQLVNRDLKVKYKRSILGYLWSLLNPLMMMIVLSAVFSHIFRFSIENFPIYLLTGQVLFTFLSESTSMAMSSVIQNASLIKKVYVPKFIFPLSKIFSSFVNLLYSLIAVVIMLLFFRIQISWTIILFPIPIIYLFVMCVGLGLILSVAATYFRDVIYLYGIVIQAWTYLTPLFYPIDAVSQSIQTIIRLNPMYHIITYFRDVIMYGTIPTMETNLICAGYSISFLIIGIIVFKKYQKNFLLYV
ncbi:ABC transporter [Desulfitobacterium hafniense]|uniref:Transport permease protein n=1 Tax=Desulfitobacterium hafniense TaxID=49338 RepID=A0A0W1JQ80_DESHA|nr:ABC transporter [Desulfitobacterium hafniense]